MGDAVVVGECSVECGTLLFTKRSQIWVADLVVCCIEIVETLRMSNAVDYGFPHFEIGTSWRVLGRQNARRAGRLVLILRLEGFLYSVLHCALSSVEFVMLAPISVNYE